MNLSVKKWYAETHYWKKIPFSPNESQDLSIYNLFYLLDGTPLESSGSHVVSIIDNATVDTLVNAALHTCRELPLVSVPRNTCTKLQVRQFWIISSFSVSLHAMRG